MMCSSLGPFRAIRFMAGRLRNLRRSAIRLTLATAMLVARLNAGVDTDFFARAAMSNVASYHFLEVVQTRGRLVLPDFGYVDFGHSNYRELFGGGGSVICPGKYLTWIQEAYFVRAVGPAAKGAAYIQPWSFVGYSIPHTKLVGQTVYFIYLPLNTAARIQHVLDRAKLEYEFNRFKLGAGYAGYKFDGSPWQNKPFLTCTVKTGRAGSFEFWAQRLPGNSWQAQVRYGIAFK